MVGLGALSMAAARVCVSAAGVTAGGGPQRGGQDGQAASLAALRGLIASYE